MKEVVTIAFQFSLKYESVKHKAQLLRDIQNGITGRVGGGGMVGGKPLLYSSEMIGTGRQIDNKAFVADAIPFPLEMDEKKKVNCFVENVYRWECPECSQYQDLRGFEPSEGDILICLSCKKEFEAGEEE